METKETTIIDVKLDAGKVAEDLQDIARQIVNVKNEQKQLDEEYKEGKISATEYTKATAAMKDELSWLQKQQKGVIATTKLLTATSETYSDSLNGQRQKLADMQKAYDQLDKATRESKSGKAFLKQIQEQSEAVKNMEQETGRAQRSVGDYKGALEAAGIGIGAFTKKMLLFLKNPWVLTIGAIVAVFKKLIDTFKGSEDRMNEMRKAFAPLKAVGDMITKVFDGLAKTLGSLASGALAKVTEGVSWLFKAIDKLGKKMGKDWGLSEAFETAAANTKKATEATEQYDKARRALVVTEAKTEKEIADLRAKAADKERYTAAERIAMLEQAKDKELVLAAEQKRVAQLRLTALQAEAANTENAKEINDELAEARAAVIRTETAYLNMERSLNKQISAFRKEEMSEQKQATKEQEKREKESEKITKASLDYRLAVEMAALGEQKKYSHEAFEVNQKYFDDLLALYQEDSAEYANAQKAKLQYEQDFADKRKDLEEKAAAFLAQFNSADTLKDEYEQKLRDLEEFHDQELVSDEEYEKAKAQLQEQYRQNKAQADLEMADKFLSQAQQLNEAVSAIENAELERYKQDQESRKKALDKRLKAGEISEAEYNSSVQKLDEETERKEKELEIEQAKRNKAFNIMQATINTALAIINALATMPAPANIAMAALAGATGAAQVAAIAAEPLPQFEHGGTIPGNSYTGDRVLIRANSGEGVYTGTQANNLLQRIANSPLTGDANYEPMAAAMSAAIAQQPAPVVVYSELKEFGDKVTTYDEISRI